MIEDRRANNQIRTLG